MRASDGLSENYDEIIVFADEFLYLCNNFLDMATNRYSKSVLVILIFAVLHGLCCFCCRTLGIEDSWVLTLLTIAMVFILGYQRGMKIYFIIAAIILVNVLAYLMGNAIPLCFVPLFGPSLWINVFTTTFTTLVLGFVFELAATIFLKNGHVSATDDLQPREFRHRWVVRVNDRIVPVKTEQIAYFFSEDKSNYLVTFDGGKYIVDATMDSILADLDPRTFFRINRGCILSLSCIESAVVTSGRYSVNVHPSLGVSMVVARSRVDDFLTWLQ